jgi:hypothetical protein
MKKEEFKLIIEEQKNLNNLPNNKLVEFMDKLSLEFEQVKKNVIESTYYLDNIESLYNNILEEYQKRTK